MAQETSYTALPAALLRCVKKGLMSGEESIVDDSQCDAEEMPPRAQVCHLACPDDCVVGPWGPWSSCPLVRRSPSTPKTLGLIKELLQMVH